MNSHEIREAHKLLEKLLGPELTEVIKAVEMPPGPDNPYYVEIPTGDDVDLSIQDLMSFVARTSNRFGRAARAAAKARANLKLAEAQYKLKQKTNLKGKNPAEREANAMEAAADEFIALSVVEAVVELAESQEAHARIASESARKLLDKVQNINIAAAREAHGEYQERDFTSQW